MIDGWINLNKPKGFSSAYCLNIIKSKFKKIKIGHAGTLDPLAEGVLPIALGEATKTVSLIHLLLKSYLFEIQWGSETDTLDLEGKVINSNEIYPNFTARSFASLLGLILKPIKTALEAFAKDTSVSVMAPTDDKTISGLTSSC